MEAPWVNIGLVVFFGAVAPLGSLLVRAYIRIARLEDKEDEQDREIERLRKHRHDDTATMRQMSAEIARLEGRMK